MKRFAAVSLLATLLGTVAAVDKGPTKPVNSHSVNDCFGPKNNVFFADEKNICWYHECVPEQGLIARRCALGTHMAYNYENGDNNPCEERFEIEGMYECTRDDRLNKFNQAPPCFTPAFQASCKNGGVAKWSASICWCDCPPEFDGLPDCSRAQLPYNDTEDTTSGPCVDGVPKDDWCRKAGGNPCKNGGVCVNQCDSFICMCPVPFTKSKLCDRFFCDPNNANATLRNAPCLNGGVCHRGDNDPTPDPNNRQEFATCDCPPGFTGTLCGTPISG